MTVEQLGQVSNYCVASATGVLALAFVAYVAQWGFARTVPAERSLVAAGGSDEPAAPTGTDSGDLPDGSDVAGSIGFSLSALATVILLAGVVTRGMAAGRVPWGNMYEFGCIAILFAMVAYLALERVWAIDWVGPLVTAFATIVLGSTMLFVYVPPGPLVPALDSYWLVIHVLGAITAGAAFLVGAAASILYLLKARAERTTPEAERTGFLWRIPSSAVIDQVAYRVHAFAFPIWTFAALIAGPIWAQAAWGRYWGWDAKEVWAFITWVFYAAYLHARATAGWRGKAAALLALAAFSTFLFNYIGVNLFVGGLHSYAK
jgi:cytochrome c-type biogenesis protein CcsB